jgi:hypothetical protein
MPARRSLEPEQGRFVVIHFDVMFPVLDPGAFSSKGPSGWRSMAGWPVVRIESRDGPQNVQLAG